MNFLEAKNIYSPQKQWHVFPPGQIDTLTVLSADIIGKYGIDPENVVGHSDVAPQRKVDPGPCFPWKELAQRGIGVWYSDSVDLTHSDKPTGISVPWMQQSLSQWGYAVPKNGMLDLETQNVVKAFQMHFRPEKYDGTIDDETSDILDRLVCQHHNRQEA